MTNTTWPPPWTLKPTYGEPEALDTGEGARDDIHSSVSWGFALNVDHDNPDDPTSPLTIGAHFSDADLARGFSKAQVTPEQLDRFALLLMAKAARVRAEESER
jgi:hypothetical protein